MADDGLTLEELSERTGVEARTLRSWISEGLLSPPFKAGRGARYPSGNADRALAVRALKEVHGLSLSDIGRRFMLATEDQVRGWACEIAPTFAPRGSARDYLRRIRAADAARLSPGPPDKGAAPALAEDALPPRVVRGMGVAPPARDLTQIERLIVQLEQALGTPAPRRSRGAVWTRIAVTSDLEISVRGDLEPRERALFEQLADQFRAILTGGTTDD